MVVDSLSLSTADGVQLEAERVVPDGASRATVVLCHPHPEHGGTMRSVVISALFSALPPTGITCLRFNFRGVEGSTGAHEGGEGELVDVVAALDAAEAVRRRGEPLLLAGWSFGGDMALATDDSRVTGWLAIAPPLRGAERLDAVARDPRPKHLVLAGHDEVRDADSVIAETAGWIATDTEVIPGASHYFFGRTDRVVDAALRFVERL
jgi:alpha/beta superfamily hydrolase